MIISKKKKEKNKGKMEFVLKDFDFIVFWQTDLRGASGSELGMSCPYSHFIQLFVCLFFHFSADFIALCPRMFVVSPLWSPIVGNKEIISFLSIFEFHLDWKENGVSFSLMNYGWSFCLIIFVEINCWMVSIVVIVKKDCVVAWI